MRPLKTAFLPAPRARRLSPGDLGYAATLALHDELSLTPKPGLVTLIDRGSHDDMDAHTFMRSLFALRRYFPQIAQAGYGKAPFEALERCGIAAEARMLAATSGINTHRGAIFVLGLLCAAGGAVLAERAEIAHAAQLREALRSHWGQALAERAWRTSGLAGGIAARRYGLRGAAQEAALGFPVLFETAVPALADALARGLTLQQARLDTLFHTMAVLDDCNLAHRAGLEGLRHGQRVARQFLEAGGSVHRDGLHRAQAICKDFVARRLSPGGAADTLAAACWVVRVCEAA